MPAPVLDVVLGADWAAASIARERVQHWLQRHRWSPAQVEELVLAVSEAVSNSVEHGYDVPHDTVDHPGVIELDAEVTASVDGLRQARFTVRDHGRWREPDSSEATMRGHGMLIMRTCTNEFTIDGTADGTTVVLTSRPVPPATPPG